MLRIKSSVVLRDFEMFFYVKQTALRRIDQFLMYTENV